MPLAEVTEVSSQTRLEDVVDSFGDQYQVNSNNFSGSGTPVLSRVGLALMSGTECAADRKWISSGTDRTSITPIFEQQKYPEYLDDVCWPVQEKTYLSTGSRLDPVSNGSPASSRISVVPGPYTWVSIWWEIHQLSSSLDCGGLYDCISLC
jgi:hypothetical protein